MQAFDGSAHSSQDSSEPATAIVSTFVLDGLEPLRVVVHHDDGGWTFTCGTADAAEHLVTGHVAERDAPADDWLISTYEET
jgi:hypothetical protein